MSDALPIPLSAAAERISDPSAFAGIYLAHYHAVAGALYRRTGDPHLTEDLASETFLAAYRAIDQYQSTSIPIRVWLLRIATNKVNRWVRRRHGLTRRLRELAHIRPAVTATPDTSYPSALAALLRLPAHYQDVLSLHHLEGLSLDQVAAALGCRVPTVKSRLARARDALRRQLLSQGDAR